MLLFYIDLKLAGSEALLHQTPRHMAFGLQPNCCFSFQKIQFLDNLAIHSQQNTM
jgi:hypothetical protein